MAPTEGAGERGAARPGAGAAWRAWALTVVLIAAATGLHPLVEGLPTVGAPPRIPWWAVALLFYATEVFVVHLQVHEEPHSFSLSEIPLVVGLFFLPVEQLVIARLVAGALALTLNRELRPLKVTFNLAHFWLGACLAALVFHRVIAFGDPLGPAGWAAAFLAPLVTLAVSDLAIDAAVLVTGGGMHLRDWTRVLGLGAASTVANSILALTAVTILWRAPMSSWLVLGLATVFFLSYRAYTLERQKHETLELLQEARDIVRRAERPDGAILDLLSHLRTIFRAQSAQLTMVEAEDGASPRCISVTAQGTVTEEVAPATREWIASLTKDALLLDAGAPELAGHFLVPPAQEAMVAPLRGDGRVVGAVMVSDRVGDVDSFRVPDVHLFGTVVSHASVALENGRLERSLAHVTELEERLRHQAFHDPLTGLANRALFLDRVGHAMAPRRTAEVGVIFLDLDDFKTVNDSLGHEAGDQLLTEVAERLRRCLRPGDTAARLGGDEFAILLENMPKTSVAIIIAHRIADEMDAPFVLGGKEVVVRASVGIATDASADDAKELLRNADIAMYKAKGAGKGRYEIFKPDMQVGVLERLELKTHLQQAVQDRSFVLHYSPVVDLRAGRIVGTEALLRWRHPHRGLLLPDSFIPMAEETGQIHAIGRFVLHEACRRTAEWQAALGTALDVSVNLSPKQLAHHSLLDDIVAALRRSGLAPSSLILEVTERALLQDGEASVSKLRALEQLGVRLALDDFGIGYSSLDYLRRFPLDMLKIPRSFVEGVTHGSEDASLARAIVNLATSLELEAVAEGIERAEQLEGLREMGCGLGQGYLFGLPADAINTAALLSHPTFEIDAGAAAGAA